MPKPSKSANIKESEMAFLDTIDDTINKFVHDVNKKLFTENSAQTVKRSDQNQFNFGERVTNGPNAKTMLTDLLVQQKQLFTQTLLFQKFKPDKSQLNQNFLKLPSQ